MSDSDGDDDCQYGAVDDPYNDTQQGGEEEKQEFSGSGMVMRQFEPENMDVDNQNAMEPADATPFRSYADVNEAQLEHNVLEEHHDDHGQDDAPESNDTVAAIAEASQNSSVCPHSHCYMSSLKGARNGFYYGSRLRFAHAFVMGVLFGKGTIRERFNWAIKMAISHGHLLATFAFCYKTVQCILSRLLKTNSPLISFLAGIIGSQFIIKPQNKQWTSVNRQLAYYLFSRVVEGIFIKLKKHNKIPNFEGFPAVYLISWGFVMYLFELDKTILNKSLVASMDFIYKESDKPVQSWKEFVPVDVPDFSRVFSQINK